MRGENEIVEELQGLDDEIKRFPTGAHWFCPRRNNDDSLDYDHPDEPEDDVTPEAKLRLIKDAEKRHDVAYRFAIIFGLSAEVTGVLLEDYTTRLHQLLTTCDKCVRNWHMGRKEYLKQLAEEVDDETVAELSKRINLVDFQRMSRGLAAAEALLERHEPEERKQALIAKHDATALMALYEVLCCEGFHKSEPLLGKYFNYVFEQVQNRKILRIGDTLPAMARFLFSSDPKRHKFAQNSWTKMETQLTTKTFDWVVHDVLEEAIVAISQQAPAPEDMLRFWQGFLHMFNRMDEDLITHSLRAMEVQPSVYLLALQHLASDSEEVVQLVIEVIRSLLDKSPKNFWSAFDTLSPAVVAEQIFASPGFEKLLMGSQDFDHPESSPVTSWIQVFISSLQPIHQHDACRCLLNNLLERLQDVRFPEPARLSSCRAGLDALSVTLQSFVKPDYKINPSTSLIVIGDIMGLVNANIATITGCAELQKGDTHHLELKRLGMLVIRDALALDCKALSAEFYALEAGTQIQRGLQNHSQSIWQAVLDIFRPGNLDLAKSILAATSALTGLDQIWPASKRVPKLSEDQTHYNKSFKQLNDNVSRVFDRLSDFVASDLRHLYENQLTARPMFAGLLSADQNIYEASVLVLKQMTGQESKEEAITSLVEHTFATTLSSLTFAVARITRARKFSPVPYLLNIGRRILKALCGNTGILRTRSAISAADQTAVMGWWSAQWRAMDMIFSSTESWATRVTHSTEFMQNFCRDAMEYAELLFDQHNVLASALRNSSLQEAGDSPKASSKASITKVLDVICHNVHGMTMMIRLRDEYLVSQITSLLSKLLRSLGQYDLEIDEDSSEYIKDACRGENDRRYKRTNLTRQQKAELQRTLDEHQGIEIIESTPQEAVKKQSRIDTWSKSADGVVNDPSFSHRVKLPVTQSARSQALLEQLKANAAKKEQAGQQFVNQRRQAEEDKKRLKDEAIAKAKAIRGTGVRGEGSGLHDIGGIVGKDHAPIRSEIMVGSSDEDSDEDDEDETNAIVKSRKAASKMVSEYDESRRRALKQQQLGPVKKTKIQRSAKDMRARVEPNMDKLYLEILNWDIFYQGDKPPSNMECVRIEDRFLELDRYQRTFFPLLISEVWRSLVTAKDENNFKPIEIKVLNRLSVDKFMEVSTNMPMSLNRDLKMVERDIVLLSKSSDPLNNPQEPHCLARVDRVSRKRDVMEVIYRISRDVKPALLQYLVPNGSIFAIKIADMTTTQREYAALSSLEFYDLCSEVLEAKPSPIQNYGEEKTNAMVSRYNLNKGQAKAILSAYDNDGFTLIQGPPGSGKTKTIIAMVGALLTNMLRDEQQQAPQPQLQNQPRGAQKPASDAPKKKLLICAPSNAAVDELVVRLKEGIQPLHGPLRKINVIRIGRSDAINADVKDVMLDELVRQKLEGDNGEKNKLLQDRDKLHQEAGKVKVRLNEIRPQMDAARETMDKALELQLQREFDGLKRNQAHLNARIDADKESGNTVSRQNEINRRRFQQEIIDGAHVLCSTLSGSGHDMFKNLNVEFETVIIDEAAQCIELSALIPLKYGCSKCILVGDPEQLPPTVLSRAAQSYGYEQSLFVRMQRNHPKDIHLLDTQYRMHPEISVFPSQEFYHSRLVDGPNMAPLREKPWHVSSILGPYRFFDVEGVQTKEARGHSFINVPELEAAMSLYHRLKSDYRGYDFKGKIGIITTYKAQLKELRIRFERKYGNDIFEEIEFNTTDAFQGREREIIIFSCVRAKATGGIGFLGDIRRMNVGLTRAKSSLWVLGDSRSLQQGQFWNKLIVDAKARDRYTGGDVMGLLSRPTSRDRVTSKYLNGSAPAPGPSSAVPGVKDESEDVEMVDASSASSSRKSSIVALVGPTGQRAVKPEVRSGMGGLGIKKQSGMGGLGIRREGKNLSPPAAAVNEHGKRSRDTSIMDDGPTKEVDIPKRDLNKVDLAAAVAAREAVEKAQKAAAPPRPRGVPPPRRPRAPADPFIQKKKPKRS